MSNIIPVSCEPIVNSEQYVSDSLIFFGRVLRALHKKKDMAVLCKSVLQLTVNYSIVLLNKAFKTYIETCKFFRLKSLCHLPVWKLRG
jgi:hypothetical protein